MSMSEQMELDIPDDFVILSETAVPTEPRIIEVPDMPVELAPKPTISVRWTDDNGVVNIARLDQLVHIAVEPIGNDEGYYLVGRLLGVPQTIVLNLDNPEPDAERAVSTAIQIIKLSYDALTKL